MMEDYRDKDVLRRLYYDEGLTMNEIAAELCVSQECIWSRMKKYGLKARPANSIPKLYDVGGGKQMTAYQIADITGCTKSAVLSRLFRGWKGEQLLEPVRNTGRHKR